jgi:hypothetical protein
MSDLRNHLFAALEGLADKTNPMDVNRAQAIASVSREIIQSAKVELAFVKLSDAKIPYDPRAAAKFFAEEADPRINPHPSRKSLSTGRDLGGTQ